MAKPAETTPASTALVQLRQLSVDLEKKTAVGDAASKANAMRKFIAVDSDLKAMERIAKRFEEGWYTK